MRLPQPVAGRKRFALARGFTLVELLTVVAITGVLATIGTMLVRQRFRDAKTAEATSLIQAIRGAEESRRSEAGNYLNCSESEASWYPASPDGTYRAWEQPDHDDWRNWRQLGVSRPEGTQFGFLVHAGTPATDLPTIQHAGSQPTWPPRPDPWYVIQALGDRDSDTKFSRLLATSFNGELFVENDGE